MPKAPTTKATTRKQSKRQSKTKSAAVEPKKRRVSRKLAATSGDGPGVTDALEPVALLRRPSVPPDANTKGLPTLPVELHLEIVSYLPYVPIPCLQSGILDEESRIKFDTMFAISQTCRVLHHLFKPLLWETLEVCALSKGCEMTEIQKNKAMATELVFWLEVVCVRAPALSSYVRVFNVALTSFSSRGVYEEFTRCLQLLPNLHTLQIVAFPDKSEHLKCLWHLSDALKAIALPTIHTLTITRRIYQYIASHCHRIFPNLRHLSLTEIHTGASGQYYIMEEQDYTTGRLEPHSIEPHNLVEIQTLQLSTILPLEEPEMLRLVKLFPHLRVTPRIFVPYRRNVWLLSEEQFLNRYPEAHKALQALSRLTRLHTIVLDCKRSWDDDPSTCPVVMERVCNLAIKLVSRNLGREENADVVHGRVRWCHGDEWFRDMRVLRPVNED